MTDLASEELFQMAIEKVFVALKGLGEAKDMIAESRSRANEEDSGVPGGDMKEEVADAVKSAITVVTSMFSGDNLTGTITQCIRNLSIELIDLGGVQLEFSGVKVKVEKVEMPQAVGFTPGVQGLPHGYQG